MQYTTQQLQGGQRYSHKTRIGNWNEDMELKAIKQTDYDAKRSGNKMPFDKTLSKYQQSYQKVPWSFSQDGLLRSGNQIMLKNKKTNGFLVTDIGERQLGVEEAYSLTTCKDNPGPMTRSIFTIHRAEKIDLFGSDDIIRYGQKVKISSNPYIFRKPLFMSSTPLGPQVYSPVSRHQECSMHANETYLGTWVIDSLDPNDRFERQGEPIKANDPILIRHCQTAHYFASDTVRHGNDFGGEFEVMNHSFALLNRTQNLELEKKGSITSDVPTKFQQDQNVWFMVTAPDPSYAVPMEELNKFTIEDLVAEIKQKLLERSSFGIKGIARIFKAMDDNGNKQLDVDDFRWCFIDFGISVTKEEAAQVLDYFDRDKNGTVSYDEFLRFLKGDLNATRKAWIRKAYEKLDVNKDGQVKLDDIAQIYDASQHPEVIDGRKTPDDIFREFMSQWDCQNQDGIVTFDEFCDYYSGVSCSIDSDDYFGVMMTNAWKL